MRTSLSELATQLATTQGGFTLWTGAGASIALSKGRTPSWSTLVCDLGVPEDELEVATDMPLLLERLAQGLGHRKFRKELRTRLVEPVTAGEIDLEVFLSQSTLGARAASLVSFNIEQVTALPFVSCRNGTTFVGRTFRERSSFAHEVSFTTEPGITSPPVYFPHGILSQGNVVMTRAEYDKHLGSLAVTTAVHLAIGGDLVIIGMSLGDTYLRDAILQNCKASSKSAIFRSCHARDRV